MSMNKIVKTEMKHLGGVKDDAHKAPLSLVDPDFVEELAKCLSFGENKYGGPNWIKGIDYSRVIDATKRHIAAFERGENFDEESGYNHLHHAACCLMFLGYYENHGYGDRYDNRRYKRKKTLPDV